jgi:hypothetical protein
LITPQTQGPFGCISRSEPHLGEHLGQRGVVAAEFEHGHQKSFAGLNKPKHLPGDGQGTLARRWGVERVRFGHDNPGANEVIRADTQAEGEKVMQTLGNLFLYHLSEEGMAINEAVALAHNLIDVLQRTKKLSVGFPSKTQIIKTTDFDFSKVDWP